MRVTAAAGWLAFAVLAAALPSPRRPRSSPIRNTRASRSRGPRTCPSDATLEAAGAVIGKVDIDIRNIFDDNDPRETNGLFRLANQLHIRTKRASIQAQLLFASGDRYSARKLAETERALRLLTYVYDAHIVPVRYADGKVDVRVITKDVWTLSPGISFGRAGGTQQHQVQSAGHEFSGLGKDSAGLARQHRRPHQQYRGLDRPERVRFAMDLGRSPMPIRATVSQRSLQVAQPFYSLDAPWSTKITAVEIRPHDFPLQSGRHRRSIQRQRVLVRTERRPIQAA